MGFPRIDVTKTYFQTTQLESPLLHDVDKESCCLRAVILLKCLAYVGLCLVPLELDPRLIGGE